MKQIAVLGLVLLAACEEKTPSVLDAAVAPPSAVPSAPAAVTPSHVHVCIDRKLPDALAEKAADVAFKENASNRPTLANVDPQKAPRHSEALAIVTTKKWAKGNARKTLRVRFLDGSAKQRAKVEAQAHGWEPYEKIGFVFGSDPAAELRVSFVADPGSWSAIGTDALVADAYPPDKPTMNFGWLRDDTDDEEYARVVLHEFGHALGAIHEHQNPSAAINWNKKAVYDYYMAPPNNWTQDQVDWNLFHRYSASSTNASSFDPKSIMAYWIPKEFTTDGFSVSENAALSDADKSFIGQWYPK